MSTSKGYDMAIIDYTDILSGTYANLSLPAKALIPVLATLADKITGLLPKRHSKLEQLAKFAGISPRATQTALTLLHETDRIILTKIQGHPASIIYQPIAQFSSKAGNAPPATPATHDVPLQPNQPSINFHLVPTPHAPGQERQDPCSSLNSSLKTTTAYDIPKMVLKDMINKHGINVVVEILNGMKRKKEVGEKIENPGAYFRQCCKNGWVPDSKALQEKAASEKRFKFLILNQAAKDAQYEAMVKRLQEERDDPVIQTHIQNVQDEFWTKISGPTPGPLN
jgi:hypothetical protein